MTLIISERVRQTLKALKNKEIDSDYVSTMDLTPEEKSWIFNEEFDLDSILGKDELDIQGTVRTWGTEICDKILPPIEDHHYIFLAGVQGAGKSTIGFFLAEKNAQLGHTVLFYTLEMSVEQMIGLNSRKTAGITKEQWRDKTTISNRQKEVYRKRKKELQLSKENPLIFVGGDELLDKRIETILEHSNQYVTKKLIIIDNLDLIPDSNNGTDNNKRQEHISRYLLQWTNEHQIPVVIIHHIKKGGNGSIDDLRGSGKLSDDADVVVMASRPTGEGLSDADKHKTNLFVAKDRDWGQILVQPVYFHKGKFLDEGDWLRQQSSCNPY